MLNKDFAYRLFEKVLSKAKYHTVLTLTSQEEGLTRFANSEIHQNVVKSDDAVSFTILNGKKVSTITTNVIDEDSLIEALHAAEEKLEFLPEGDFEYPEVNTPENIENDTYNPQLDEDFSIENRADIIKDALAMIHEDFTAAGSLTLDKTCMMIMNTNGIKRYARTNSITYNIVVTHKDNASGFAELCVNDSSEINIKALTEKAYKTAQDGIDAITIEPGHYDIIMPPHAVIDFLFYMGYLGLGSKAILDGISFLKDKVGEKVFGDNISISDDWTNKYVSSLPFDFEGFERSKLNIIENGILKELPYDSKCAALMNKENTGHSVGYEGQGGFPLNIVMAGGDSSIDEMIKSTKRGLLVTRFNYTNIVNPIEGLMTGLTRDGLFLIEDGKIKCPVKNMRFTDSIPNVFNNIEAITTETLPVKSYFGNFVLPGIKVNNFHITGKTS
ncbi:TldD/PmbA family protein [Oceanirhabdus sp. W0125-5]|uniref:TldD/PmbA family protein n=1 Tax=Oceanirhabdus sp. W0125-5 TaxID=2999116 RepID=UPI0022F31D33|nr:metallopeptidase TldD-related protein [Oceanirhabdus sp. W0125-5]WBW96562.1 metallopeptidase TldD-related protein [Oceanirhabdus sp. W0125-5]